MKPLSSERTGQPVKATAAIVCQPQLGASLRKGWLRMIGTEVIGGEKNARAICAIRSRQKRRGSFVEDYRAKLIARITGLYSFCEFPRHYRRRLGLAQLLEQSMRPYSANGAQVLAAGPDVELEPHLALALHLVFHELAANASKFGALSSRLGSVDIEWTVRHVPGAPSKLAIVWVEHGGPEVKHRRHAGFGSRLIKTVLGGYGGVRLDLNNTGLACFMVVDLDRPDARIEERAGR